MDKRFGDHRISPPHVKPVRRRAVLPLEGPFVGRDDELRRLREALTLAAKGEGSTIFLTGETAAELLHMARRLTLPQAEAKAHLVASVLALWQDHGVSQPEDLLAGALRVEDGLPSLGPSPEVINNHY